MGNKYVDVSAAFNGDGTLSTPAASAGAPGAWNDLASVFAGTPAYGALAAGDTVFLRSHDGSNDITCAAGVLTFNSTGTASSPINFIVDDGIVWPEGGQLTVTHTNYVTFTDYNNFIGDVKFSCLNTTSGTTYIVYKIAHNLLKGISLEDVASGNIVSGLIGSTGNDIFCSLIDCCFATTRLVQNSFFNLGSNAFSMTLINPVIDLTGGDSDLALFGASATQDGAKLKIIGGKVVNSVDTQYLFQRQGSMVDITLIGFDTGSLIMGYSNDFAANIAPGNEFCVSQWGGQYNAAFFTPFSTMDWQSGKNYPTLNAVLPDSETYWSWKYYPGLSVVGIQTALPLMTKYYSSEAAAKTVTFNFLASEDFTNITKDQVFMSVIYTSDTDGLPRSLNTYDPTSNVDSSTAGWSATVYGEKNYNKYKLSVTTPTAIKQYTNVFIQVWIGIPAQSTGDFFFIDPEIELS